VRACLDSGWVSSTGEYVDRFEREFAAYLGAPHAIATTSGTAALHVALLLAGVRPGDEVVVPALTFIAPANAVRYVGARPVFVDVDPRHWQIDPDQVAAFLQEDCERRNGTVWNRVTGRRVSALLPVHLLGHPCDLDRLEEMAATFGLAIVEDATESLGARYRGRPLGQAARLACFSFNGNKVMTTGGGGMLVTSDPDLAREGKYLTTQAKDDAVEFVHRHIGFNYRLTNVQAAIGCAQLERLDEFLDAKRRIAARYANGLHGLEGIELMAEAPWARASFWLYTILVNGGGPAEGSRALMRALHRRRIQTRPLWQPLHLSPAHQESYHRPCPVAERLNEQGVTLPSSTDLDDENQQRVIDAVRDLVSEAAQQGAH
jgi:perosamine synthetase